MAMTQREPRRRPCTERIRAACGAAAAAALLLGGVAVAPAAAEVFRIDPGRSELVVRIFRAGIGSALAHDHVVRASWFSGGVEMDPGRPSGARIRVTVDATSLEADVPEVRERYGLSSGLDEGDRKKIQATMEGEGQLDVRRHPTIELRSTAVRKTEEGYEVTADLTLHGTTRAVTFPASVEIAAGSLTASGSFRFRQSDFGIEPYSAALGAIRNQDEVELGFRVVAELPGEQD